MVWTMEIRGVFSTDDLVCGISGCVFHRLLVLWKLNPLAGLPPQEGDLAKLIFCEGIGGRGAYRGGEYDIMRGEFNQYKEALICDRTK